MERRREHHHGHHKRCTRCGHRHCRCVVIQQLVTNAPSVFGNSAVSVMNDPLVAPLGSIPPYNVAAERGMFYTVTSGDHSVTTEPSFLVLQLTNPANSGKTLHIRSIRGTSSVATTIDIFRDAVFTASGTSVPPRNTNWGSSDASMATGKWLSTNVDPTVGGVLLQSVDQSGGATELDYDGRFIIPSTATARTIYIRLTNLARNANMAIDISWWET